MEKLSQRKTHPHATILFDFVGCKLNRFELEFMRTQAEALGFAPLIRQKNADVIVINTCSVTSEAGKDSRKLIRKFRQENPDSYLVVTGCYSQTDIETVRELEVDLILSNFEKDKFFEIMKSQIEHYDGPQNFDTDILSTVRFQSRPFLKIQDGCDAFCSYCIIPRARGRSRSIPFDTVLLQIKELCGYYPEIVITGVNLGQYEDNGRNLCDLLNAVLDVENLHKLRISSIEPTDLNGELLELLCTHPKICRHIHLPLQGTTNSVLKDMRRHYDFEFYHDLSQKIRSFSPDICIGADVITGFPTESDTLFEEGVKNLNSLPLNYLHVFSFSSRENTVAAKLQNPISPEIKKERTRLLFSWSENRRQNFIKTQIQRPLEAVLERNPDPHGILKGLSDNWIAFEIKTDLSLRLRPVEVELALTAEKIHAKLLKPISCWQPVNNRETR